MIFLLLLDQCLGSGTSSSKSLCLKGKGFRDKPVKHTREESGSWRNDSLAMRELGQLGYVVRKDQNRTEYRCFGQMWMARKGAA